LKIRFANLAQFLGNVQNTRTSLDDAVDDTLTDLAYFAERGIKEKMTPQHGVDTGETRRSVHSNFVKSIHGSMAKIGPEVETALYLEEDTDPHWPPIQDLYGWARRHGVSAYAVAKKISIYGTEGLHMVGDTYVEVLERARRTVPAIAHKVSVAWSSRRGGVRVDEKEFL
jgi:hypothetical protein